VTIGADTSRSAVSEAQVEPCFRLDGSVVDSGVRWCGRAACPIARIADLHTLLANPGVAIPAMTLAGEPSTVARSRYSTTQLVAAYRARLVGIGALSCGVLMRWGMWCAGANRRCGTRQLARGVAYGVGLVCRAAPCCGDPSERARKAVTARVRDAIARIVAVHPDLGAHLRASIRTGTTCMYEPARRVAWRV
jgi:hypothetical protein